MSIVDTQKVDTYKPENLTEEEPNSVKRCEVEVTPRQQQPLETLKSFNLEESGEKIRRIRKYAAEGIVEIGRELQWVKKHLEHGLWEKWVRDELSWHPCTAWRFMKAAEKYENLASTQDFNVNDIGRQFWGNTPSVREPRSQDDVYTWLEKEVDRSSRNIHRIIRQLTFCGHLTPSIFEKLLNLSMALRDALQNMKRNDGYRQVVERIMRSDDKPKLHYALPPHTESRGKEVTKCLTRK